MEELIILVKNFDLSTVVGFLSAILALVVWLVKCPWFRKMLSGLFQGETPQNFRDDYLLFSEKYKAMFQANLEKDLIINSLKHNLEQAEFQKRDLINRIVVLEDIIIELRKQKNDEDL